MFKHLDLNSIYFSYYNDLAEEFYNPILKNTVSYDRISAYFSAKSLAKYSSGLEYFARNGYKYRLLISQDISKEDYKAMKEGHKLKERITQDMLSKMKENLSLEEKKDISNLAYLIAIGIVEIKIAFVKNGVFHDKCGIFYDREENIICYRGSNNETAAAIDINYEVFTVTCSWILDSKGFYGRIIEKSKYEFDKLWNNEHEDIIVLGVEDIIMEEILKFNEDEIIVDSVLLEEDCVILDYNDTLLLKINTDDYDWVIKGAFYKLKLRRYIDSINDKYIVFKDTLSYLDYQKIDSMLKSKAKSLGKRYFTSKRLLDYIEARNIYIDKRESLGIEIKRQDEKLINHFEEYRKVVDDNMTRKLRDKQMWDSFFMFAMNKSGNFSVPGSGKTSSVLGVYAYLKSKELVKRIVMVGPKNSFGSWIDEFKICFENKEGLKVFNIHDNSYKNPTDKKRALMYDTGNSNLILINYESLGMYKNEVMQLIDSNTLLVFDEVHKVKRLEGEKPGTYAGHALDISKNAIYTIVMTGTPIPNSYIDLYNMLHILYNDEYKEFFGFPIKMLKNPSNQELEMINDKIQAFFCRTTKQELMVPAANSDKLIEIKSTQEEQQLFKIILNKYRRNKLVLFIRLLQLESNPKMLLQSLDLSEFKYILDMENNIDDIDYVDYSNDIENLVKSIGLTSKTVECINLIDELVSQNKKVIVWCIFKNSITNIQKLLMDKEIKSRCIYGEVELNDRISIIDEFRSGEFDVLITNPHTLAESVSLHSVCHDAVYFEYSYNLVHLLQSKDRIHRLGLPQNQYTQYYYIQSIFEYEGIPFSIDDEIYNRLLEKEKIMLDAINSNRLEDVSTSEEDLDFILSRLFN